MCDTLFDSSTEAVKKEPLKTTFIAIAAVIGLLIAALAIVPIVLKDRTDGNLNNADYLWTKETYGNFVAANPEAGGDPAELNLASLGNAKCIFSGSWTRILKSTMNTAYHLHFLIACR